MNDQIDKQPDAHKVRPYISKIPHTLRFDRPEEAGQS